MDFSWWLHLLVILRLRGLSTPGAYWLRVVHSASDRTPRLHAPLLNKLRTSVRHPQGRGVRRAPVLRLWLCIFLVLFASFGGSGSLLDSAVGEACTQSCPDDDERGRCASDCDDCLCCVHARPVMLARAAALLPGRPGPLRIDREDQAPPSADVGDILHVPILALA